MACWPLDLNAGAAHAPSQPTVLTTPTHHSESFYEPQAATESSTNTTDLDELADQAETLITCFETTEAESVLEEAIRVGRAALTLCIDGHPRRGELCATLAHSLSLWAGLTGDESASNEAFSLEEESLLLTSNSDTETRSRLCGNFAVSLKDRFLLSGDTSMLHRAIALEREALGLRSAGHPDRGIGCSQLSTSLKMLFDWSGDDDLIREAITLGKEAVGLHDADDPHRHLACTNLAASLWTLVNRGNDSDPWIIMEAIQLQREAIELIIGDDETLTLYRSNLASMLSLAFEKLDQDPVLLDEAIQLDTALLASYDKSNLNRGISCVNLAFTYRLLYDHTLNKSHLEQALSLNKEALLYPDGEVVHWRIHINLCDLYLYDVPEFHDVGTALTHLYSSVEAGEKDKPELFRYIVRRLALIGVEGVSDIHQPRLLEIYAQTVNLMPLIAGFAMDSRSQLRAFESCVRLSSDAFACAIRNNRISEGLELLEHARGIMWSQALHLQDPHMDDVPEQLAVELRSLLHALAVSDAMDISGPRPLLENGSTLRDIRHNQNDRVHNILQTIRSEPGLGRFMKGPEYSTLRNAASDHPLVILVSSEGNSHALALIPPTGNPCHIALGSIQLGDLQTISEDLSHTSRRNRHFGLGPDNVSRGIRLNRPERNPSSSLAKLWHTVVKPVLQRLGIHVRLFEM